MDSKMENLTLTYHINKSINQRGVSTPLTKQIKMATQMNDYQAVGLAEGYIEAESENQVIEAWQYLHDTRLAYKLQGWFGRTAQRLIQENIITK